jgi:hypothetical protein
MSRIIILLMLTVALQAGWFSSCETASSQPKPTWVTNLDYTLPGFYVGIGLAEKNNQDIEVQRKSSEDNAKLHLTEQIEVTVHSQIDNRTEVNNNKVNKHIKNEVTISADEILHDLTISDQWIDRDTCTYYTLVKISNAAVTLVKREKLARKRLALVKSLLTLGEDRQKVRNPAKRVLLLEEAEAAFLETDFSLITEPYAKSMYGKKIADALFDARQDLLERQESLAVIAYNSDKKISSELVGKIVNKLIDNSIKSQRLMVECAFADECIEKAKEEGYVKLAWLKIDTSVESGNMGALKGTLNISKALYDINAIKLIGDPLIASAQVIGWGRDELNWESATEKAMQTLK